MKKQEAICGFQSRVSSRRRFEHSDCGRKFATLRGDNCPSKNCGFSTSGSAPSKTQNRKLKTALAILGLVFFLLILGCLAPDFGKKPCCEMSNATQKGECKLYSSENDTFVSNNDYCGSCSTAYCAYAAFDNATNETVYVEMQSGWGAPREINCTNMSDADANNKTHPCNNIGYCLLMNATGYEAYPICTQRQPFPWENPNCTSMLCGSIKYRPARSFLPDLTKSIYFQSLGGEYAQGLYHATCNFYPLDPKTLRLIKKSKGVFQNTFRFGAGTDISDFEEARWYFPLSDKFTGLQNLFTSNFSRDRFMNYLNLGGGAGTVLPAWVAKFGEPNYFQPYDPIRNFNNYTACAKSGNGAQVPPLADGENYWFNTYSEVVDPYNTIQFDYTMPDVEKYKFFLQAAYWGQIYGSGSAWNCSLDGTQYSSQSSCAASCVSTVCPANHCVGTPIPVSFNPCGGACPPQTCAGATSDPLACSQYYIKYANGQAAQCAWYGSICGDWGEDNQVYCNDSPCPTTTGSCTQGGTIPFECNSSFDCITLTCSKEDFGYERGLCDKTDGTYANCLCHEVGTRMLTDNEVWCEPYKKSATFEPLTASKATYDFTINDFCHATVPYENPESGPGCKDVYVPRNALSSSQISGNACCLDVAGFKTKTCYDPGSASGSVSACAENDANVSIYSSGGQYVLGVYPADLNGNWTCACGLSPNYWNPVYYFGSASSVSCNITVKNSTGGVIGIYQLNQGQSATVYSNPDPNATCIYGSMEYECGISTPRTVQGCAEELNYTGPDSICNTSSLRTSPLRGAFATPSSEFMCCNDYSCLPDTGECYNEEDPCYSVDGGICYSLIHQDYCCKKQNYTYQSPCFGYFGCKNPPCPQTSPPAPLNITYSSMCVPSEACAAGASLCSTSDPHSFLFVFPHVSQMCCEEQRGGAFTGFIYNGCENVTPGSPCTEGYTVTTASNEEAIVCTQSEERQKDTNDDGVPDSSVTIYSNCTLEAPPDGFCGANSSANTTCSNSVPVASPQIKFIVNETPYNLGGGSNKVDWGRYIGYSFADDFPNSMVAQECGLQYDTLTLCPPYTINDTPRRVACLKSMKYKKYGGFWRFSKVDLCLESYARMYLIKSLGNCTPDDGLQGETMMNVSSFPKITQVYGWCEGSTFDTFVGVNLNDAYSKLNAYTLGCPDTKEGLDLGFFANIFSCNEGEYGPIVGIIDDLCGPKIRAYVADVEALRDRVDHYLKSGVMPIVWYTAGGAYAHANSGGYTVIDDCKKVDGSSSQGAVDAKAKAGLNSVITGSMFFFAPDQEPFFTSTNDGCKAVRDKACTYSDDCPFIEAKGESGIGGETYVSQAQSPPGIGETAVELGCGGNFWCIFGNKKSVLDIKCDWQANYPFLERTIGNSASFVITDIDYPDCARVGQLRKQCPRCLFAMKLDSINTLLSYDDLTVQTQYYCYDAFAFDFEANKVYIPPNATTTEMYYSIFTNMSETSRLIVQKTGRPSLVLLTIDEAGFPWADYNDTLGFMRYAYKNQSDLVNSGIFGIMYKEWAGGSKALVSQRASSTKDDKFCAFEQATNLYLNPLEKKTVYIRMDTKDNFTDKSGAPIAAPECVECNDLEKTTGQCSKTCLNMVVEIVNATANITREVNCTEDPAIANDSQRCPMEPVDSANNTCVLCTDLVNDSKFDKSIVCNITYMDGTNKTFTISDPTNVTLYPDAVSVLPKGQKCCFVESLEPPCCNGTIPISVNYSSCSNGTCTPYECGVGNANQSECEKYYITYEDGKYADCGWDSTAGQCADYGENNKIYCIPRVDGRCANELRYTYTSMTADALVVTPVIFPHSGDPLADCGMADTGGVFCGRETPVKNYKIVCVIGTGESSPPAWTCSGLNGNSPEGSTYSLQNDCVNACKYQGPPVTSPATRSQLYVTYTWSNGVNCPGWPSRFYCGVVGNILSTSSDPLPTCVGCHPTYPMGYYIYSPGLPQPAGTVPLYECRYNCARVGGATTYRYMVNNCAPTTPLGGAMLGQTLIGYIPSAPVAGTQPYYEFYKSVYDEYSYNPDISWCGNPCQFSPTGNVFNMPTTDGSGTTTPLPLTGTCTVGP